MCGIWALAGGAATTSEVRTEHTDAFMRIVGRGPDLTVIEKVAPTVHLGFHRLAIVMPGDQPSQQPIVGDGFSVVCNGEIYNHKQIKDEFPLANVRNGGSDCAAIVHSFVGNKGDLRAACASLDGVFAFVMADQDRVYIGRDPMGVRPLFYGFAADGALVVGSEVKCISNLVERIEYFPPGSCATFIPAMKTRALQIHKYWSIPTIADKFVTMDAAQVLIRDVLIKSVEKRLMGNRHFGFMLSGGLDSSLIASIATKFLKHTPHAFSVGFEDSPDLEAARQVAEYLSIPHHVLVITPKQCIDVIPEVVNALETFDPLIIRCGIAHYLLCKHISETSDVKVLLSGEGADELFGSYAYMQRAPNAFHLHKEIIRRMTHLHQYDVLRCDRSTSCHGLEIRVPFLDKKMIDLVGRLPPTYKLIEKRKKRKMEKSAFEGWLPSEVLWRSKEGFAEALGKTDLGEIIHEYATKLISEEEFGARHELFPDRTPETKEEFWYRSIFEQCYPLEKIVHVVHTKVYKTAAWHLTEEKENLAKLLVNSDDESKMSEEEMRELRRKAATTLNSGVVA
ncbi:hypothetical protein PENTCL1PPCAC_2696 [Pristionchus entomophagus]|uniref:Asparagine synthetase [glutamine-hydrolyzing] n=1 Tax=Pristionchus entomophagus TaxID=358040 RepID=A0AAV5SB77_9BILA|nr:hypothetical protein PENTCL1PPCAC_2696 [Pristionchus entomophagus]